MKKKVEVKICLGTTCFILNNSELQEIESEINPALLPYVEVLGAPCLGFCKDTQYNRVPCAIIEGEIVENVNKQCLISMIEEKVNEKFSVELLNGKHSC